MPMKVFTINVFTAGHDHPENITPLTIRHTTSSCVPLELSHDSVLSGLHIHGPGRILYDLAKLTSIKLGLVKITFSLDEEVHLEAGLEMNGVE